MYFEQAAVVEHLKALCEKHSGAAIARAIGLSEMAISAVRTGRRSASPKFIERLNAVFPIPSAPPPLPSRGSPEAKVSPISTWLNTSEARRTELIRAATDAHDALDELDLLVCHPSYQAMREWLLRLTQGTIPELSEIVLPLPTEGPAVALAEAVSQVEALIAESREWQTKVDPERSSELFKRFPAFREACIRKLERLRAGDDVDTLLKGAAWRATCESLAAHMKPHNELRQTVIDATDASNPFEVSLRTVLVNVRSINFPSSQYRNDPVGFARDILGVNLWDGQIEIAEGVVHHKDTTASTGQKIGKTVLVAVLVLWWYCCWDDAFAIITNATGKQLEKQDWMWVKRLWRQSGICFDCRIAGVKTRPCPHSQVIDGKLLESSGGGLRSDDDQRHIMGTTAKVPDDVGGYSGNHLLVVNDEASRLTDEVFEAWRGNTGAEGAKLLLLGNPLGQVGPFRRANTEAREEKNWHRIKISSVRAALWNAQQDDAHKIPGLMSMQRIEQMREADEQGEKSPAYMVRILGEYPTVDESCIFPIDLVLLAQEPDVYESVIADGMLCVSIDPSGEELRGDATVFCARRGLKVYEFKSFKGLRLDEYLDYAIELALLYRKSPSEQILLAIDADGVGARVVTRFQNYLESRRTAEHAKVRFDVVPVYFGHQAVDWEQYDLAGDEAYALTARWLRHGGVFPDTPKLQQEMQNARWYPVRRNRAQRQVEVLSGTRKDGPTGYRAIIGRSPDHLDALRIGLLAEERLGYEPAPEVKSPEQIEDEESQAYAPPVDPRNAMREFLRAHRKGIGV